MNKVSYLIPARIQSSRFPGKPLAKILGKEMILHVLDRVASVIPRSDIFVASDSVDVLKVIEKFGYQGIETSHHPTGTDRLAEALLSIETDYVINVQGDEPAFNPMDILKASEFLIKSKFPVVTGYCLEENALEINDSNTIKLVFSNSKRLMYISRAPIPGCKGNFERASYRQVCLYGYTRTALETFGKLPRSEFEIIEDHEILRFLENDIPVGVVELSNWSVPVDIESDILLAETQLRKKFNL